MQVCLRYMRIVNRRLVASWTMLAVSGDVSGDHPLDRAGARQIPESERLLRITSGRSSRTIRGWPGPLQLAEVNGVMDITEQECVGAR